MIIRVRHSGGCARLEANAQNTISSLKSQLAGLDSVSTSVVSSMKLTLQGGVSNASIDDSQTISGLGLQHGHMLFLTFPQLQASSSSSSSSSSRRKQSKPKKRAAPDTEDVVDAAVVPQQSSASSSSSRPTKKKAKTKKKKQQQAPSEAELAALNLLDEGASAHDIAAHLRDSDTSKSKADLGVMMHRQNLSEARRESVAKSRFTLDLFREASNMSSNAHSRDKRFLAVSFKRGRKQFQETVALYEDAFLGDILCQVVLQSTTRRRLSVDSAKSLLNAGELSLRSPPLFWSIVFSSPEEATSDLAGLIDGLRKTACQAAIDASLQS